MSFSLRKWGARSQSLVYYIDKKTSVPLRVSAYDDPQRIRLGKPNWVWEATSLDAILDRAVPLSSKYDAFNVSPGKDGVLESNPSLSQKIHIVEILFDSPIPETSFWPVFQEGVTIQDKEQLLGPKQSSVSNVAKVEHPVRVPEHAANGQWVGWAVLVASLVALCGAAVLWNRAGRGRV